MHATERRGRSVEATATETAAASNWSRPATTTAEASSHSSPAVRATLRLPNQSRARKKRDPIEFSFHDFDFLCLFVWLFLKFIISLA
jgi:hypothetical protein